MEQLQQNQAAVQEEVSQVRSQKDHVMETIQAVARGQGIMAKMQEEMSQRANAVNPLIPLVVETPSPPPQVNPPIHIGVEIDDQHNDFFSPRAASQYDVFGPTTNEVEKKVKAIKHKLKAMENTHMLGLDATEMCLVLSVVIPAKFKVLYFEKYKGNSDPRTHIRAYYRKMAAYSGIDRVLMHFFQDSLSGESLDWYMQLEGIHIHTWQEMVEAFLKHYQYNTDMTPYRMQLQNLTRSRKKRLRNMPNCGGS